MHNDPIEEEANEQPTDPPVDEAPNPPIVNPTNSQNVENTGDAPIDPTIDENPLLDVQIPDRIPNDIDEATLALLLTLPRGTRAYDERTIVDECRTSKKVSVFQKISIFSIFL